MKRVFISRLRRWPLVLALPVAAANLVGCDSMDSATEAEHVAKAKDFQIKGNVYGSVIELKNALTKNPDNPEARRMLGEIYARSGQGAEAEKELRRALELKVAREALLLTLAEALALQGKHEEILDEINPTGSMAPGEQASALSYRGNAWLSMNNLPHAEAEYKQALEIDPKSPLARLGLAKLAVVNNDLDKAQQTISEALRDSPDAGPLWSFQADVFKRRGELDKAEESYGKAIENMQFNVLERANRALVRIDLKRFDAAEADIAILKKRAPNLFLTRYSEGVLALLRGKYPEAQEALERAVKLNDRYPDAHYFLGVAYFLKGELQQAGTELTRYLQAVPNSVNGLKLYAWVSFRLKDFEGAKRKLLPVIQRFPNDAFALRLMGNIALAMHEQEAGLEYLRKAADLAPEEAGTQIKLGLELLRTGDTEEGLATLEKATTLAGSELGGAEIPLVSSYLQKNEIEKARAVITGLKKKHPNNPLSIYLDGLVLLAENDASGAKKAFEEALERSPADPEISHKLAQLALKEKRPDTAREYYQVVLKAHPEHLDTVLRLVDLDASEGKLDGMRKRLEEAAKQHPDDFRPRLGLARYYFAKNQPAQAIEIINAANQQAREQPDLLQVLAEAQLAMNNPEPALAAARTLVKVAPTSALSHYILAKCYAVNNDIENMRAALKQSLALDPKFLPAKLAMINLELSADPTNAVKQFNELAREYPENLEVLAQRARAVIPQLVQAKDFEKARSELGMVKDKLPTNPLPFALEGLVSLAENNLAQAKAAFEQALQRAPGDPEILRNLARVALEEGNRRDARRYLQTALDSRPQDLETLLAIAALDEMEGNSKDAVTHLEEAVRVRHSDPRPRTQLARHYLQAGQADRALQLLETARKQFQDRPEILGALVEAQMATNQAARALETAQSLVKTSPKSAVAHHELARAYARNKDVENARQALQRALELDNRFMPAQLMMVEVELASKKHSAAKKRLEGLLLEYPQNVDVIAMEGRVAMETGDAKRAVLAYSKVLVKTPSSSNVIALSQAQWRSGDRDTALRTLDDWVKAHSRDVVVLYFRSTIFLATGKVQEAKLELERVIEADQNNLLALNDLAWLLREEDPGKALEYAERVNQRAPDFVPGIDTLAAILLDRGENERGLELMEKAASLAPKAPDIRYHLARAQEQARQPAKAKQTLKALLAEGIDFKEKSEAQALLRKLGE